MFVDGAFLGSSEVIALAELSPRERQQRLADERRATKDFACGAVIAYMEALRVSRDEVFDYADADRISEAAARSTARRFVGP